MALRQRKGKGDIVKSSSAKSDEDYDNKKSKKPIKSHSKPVGSSKKKKASGKQVLFFLFCVLGIAGSVIYFFYKQYGPAILLGPGYKDFNIDAYQWRKYLDSSDKTILLIGGPHRSGTTILWKAISSHPEAVGFGDTFETGAAYSEGILFQNVYPAFGVGLEFRNNFLLSGYKSSGEDDVDISSGGGLGQYALLPESYVHWTKQNHKGRLDDANSLSKLMNRFAPHWDTNVKYGRHDGLKKAKVWIEKSPQNIVLSSFLEGVYNMPIEEDGSAGTPLTTLKKPVTKFVFMTRHPIANILATDIFIQDSMGGHRDFEVMLRNYIKMHQYAIKDSKELQSPHMWVKIEDFVANPRVTLQKIFSFLELSNDEKVMDDILEEVGTIQSDPNKKYFTQWCKKDKHVHGELVTKYTDEINSLGLGYDLTGLCS